MSAKKPQLKLAIDQLRPGVFIEMPVGWHDHPFMFNQFKITSTRQIAQLRQANILHVWGIPAKSSVKPIPADEVAEPSTLLAQQDQELTQQLDAMAADKLKKIEQMQAYRRRIKKCEVSYQTAISKVRALTSKVQSRPLQAMMEAGEVINTMADTLLSKENVVLHLVHDDRDDVDMQQHAVAVSMLAMMIANHLGLTKDQIIELGIAGLLHDIGKLKIPQQFFSGRDISPSKRKFVVEKHPSYSVDFLNLSPEISDTVKQLVLEHHEFADGSGYPTGKTINQLHPLSLIVSLVNYYELLCHPAEDAKARSPSQAISYIFKHKKHLFEPAQLNAFIKSMGIYPPGTLVRLSNGQIGIVITVDSTRLLFPNVLIYDQSIPRNEAAIIALEQEGISIDGAVVVSTLPEKVIEYLNPRTTVSFYFD